MTDSRSRGESGPVPARDLLKHPGEDAPASPPSARGSGAPATDPAAAAGPEERALEVAGEEWLARPAGVGLYGTGRLGSARLVAIQFFRAVEPGQPVREALIPAGEFERLVPDELSALFERATPIELER